MSNQNISPKPILYARYTVEFDDCEKLHQVYGYMTESGSTFSEATRLFGFEQGVDSLLFREYLGAIDLEDGYFE